METIVWFKDILAFRNYLSNQQSFAGYICLAIAESVLVCLFAESAQPVKVEGDSHNSPGNLPPSGSEREPPTKWEAFTSGAFHGQTATRS